VGNRKEGRPCEEPCVQVWEELCMVQRCVNPEPGSVVCVAVYVCWACVCVVVVSGCVVGRTNHGKECRTEAVCVWYGEGTRCAVVGTGKSVETELGL